MEADISKLPKTGHFYFALTEPFLQLSFATRAAAPGRTRSTRQTGCNELFLPKASTAGLECRGRLPKPASLIRRGNPIQAGHMRAVVSGGAGFLGSHLSDLLIEKGWKVLCLDNFATGREENVAHLAGNPQFELVRHDVTQPITVEGSADAVLHFACPASPVDYLRLPIETLEVGSLGTRNMLELAQAKEARFLLASTSECYGDPEVSPQPETYWGHVNPIGVRSCYDEGKRCAETLFFDYLRQHTLKIKVVRIFNTYGPRMHPNDGRVVSNFIVQALRGEDITLYGDGSQTRAFCYVDDLIEGMIRMMGTSDEVTGPLNIGNPHEITVRELAEQIVRLTGTRSQIVFRPLPVDDPTQRCPDISKASSLLGWSPRVSLKDGLHNTIAYFANMLENAE